MRFRRCFRQRNRAELNMPAQNHLRDRLAETIGNGPDRRVLNKLVRPPERTPGLRDDAVHLVPCSLLSLRKIRVQLHLVDGRRHARCIHPVSTHPSVLEGLVDGSHIRWGLRVLKAVVSACLLDGYSADRLGS